MSSSLPLILSKGENLESTIIFQAYLLLALEIAFIQKEALAYHAVFFPDTSFA